jgi:flagellar operon protein
MRLDSITDFTAASVQQRIQKTESASAETQKTSFRQALNQTAELRDKENAPEEITFSRHAAKRLDQRGISVNDHLKSDLENAVAKAREKGAREVAVIGNQGVFIVNVTNNVVVTTMTQEDMKNRILTNIDGAVMM